MNHLPSKIQATLNTIPSFKKVLVGCSGGMDSMVLTHILKELGYEVVLAHLNHQLRGEESDRDEQFVVEMAKKWKIECVTQKINIPKTGNLEANARKLRYEFLEAERMKYQADLIAVGHHFDDQIETILMHQKRGCGLRGERGMGFLTGRILRPLIDIPRREIDMYAKENKLQYVRDSSNSNINFERNRFRHQVVPKLREQEEFEKKIRKTIRQATEKLKVLTKKKEVWKKEYLKNSQFNRTTFNELEDDLKVEILIDLIGQKNIYSSTFNRLIDFIAKGGAGKKLEVTTHCHSAPLSGARMTKEEDLKFNKLTFIINYDIIRYYEKSFNQIKLLKKSLKPESKSVSWGNYQLKTHYSKPLYARSWRAGDRFQPSGMQGTKKLQDFFVDKKISRQDRHQIPIIVDEKDSIVCIGNLRFSEPYKHLKNTVIVQKND